MSIENNFEQEFDSRDARMDFKNVLKGILEKANAEERLVFFIYIKNRKKVCLLIFSAILNLGFISNLPTCYLICRFYKYVL